MLLPASLAQQQQLNQSLSSPNNNGGGSALLSGRRGSYASSSVDGPATVVGSMTRATLLDGGSMARAPPVSALVAGSVSPTRSYHRDEGGVVAGGVDVSPPTAAETDVPPPPAVHAVQLIHGGRCGLALLRNLRFEAMKGIATPLLLGFQLMDGLESRNTAFLEDLAKSIAAFALDSEATLFSVFREPTSLVGFPTMSGPASDKIPKDAFLELWASVVTSLLEITNPIPYDAIAWSLASLCYILKHLPSSCAYVIQTAVVCANVIHDVLELLRKHVSFHFSFACCVHYALELFDIFLGIQKPSEMLIAVFVSMFASSPAINPINAFLKMYVRRVATAENAWSLFHEEGGDHHQRQRKTTESGTPSASHLSSPGDDENLVAGASLLQRRLSNSTMHRGGGGATTQPGGGSHSGEDVADTMFWPCAFHVERHRVRLLQHYRVVSRFLSSRHHGSYLSIAHETQGEHPLEFLLNPVDGISLVILSDVAPQSWLAMQMETLKLIEEVSCQPAMVSPLLQQSGWIATYTRFLFLAFLEAYHSQAFSSGDAYVMSFSKGVLRALSALCQQDAVARAWALKLGIVRTLIQEIDLEQSVNDIRERQLKKSRESQSSAATTAAMTANNGPRQQLLSRLASLSTGSTSDDDDGDVVSVLAQTRGDFLTSPTSLKSVGKKVSSSSPAAAPALLAAQPPPSPPEQSQQRTTAAVSPPIMSSSAATSATRSYVSPPFLSSSSRAGGSATVPSTTVDVSFSTAAGGDRTDLPKPLMTNPSTMHSPSMDSLTQPLPNTASIAPEFWSERSTDTMDTRHVSEIMGSPLSMVASHTNESSLLEPSSSLQFPSSLMTRPKISIPKLSLASAPPPLYYTSNGDTGATVEATMANPSFVKSGSFAFPLGGGGGGASGASFAGIPIEMHPIHTNGNDEDDESTDDRTESEHDEEREGNYDEEEIHNKNGDSGADPVVGLPPPATLSSLSPVVVPLPLSPPVAPPAGRPPLFVPKLSLASAPPPLYYTSNGDTGATVEATMTNASFVKTGSFAFASQLDLQRVQAQLNSETALMVDMHSTGDEDDEESDEEDVEEDESCTPHNHDDNGLHSSHQAEIGESDDDDHRPLNIQATEVTIEPCTEDDEEDAKSLASNRDGDENEGDGDGQSSPPPSSGLNSNIQILKTLPTPILLSGGRGSVSLHMHMAEDQFHPSEQSLSTIDSSGALHSAAAVAATAAGSTRLDNVRPSRITMPFQHIPTSPSVLGDSASDSSALLHQHSSGHGLESEGSTSSVGLGVPSAPQRMISSDGAFSTASGVVYIPPLAMTQAALRNASTPHGAGRSPSARASRTVRLVEPGIGEGDAAANLGADDGQGDFELAQRSVRESSPDARIPGSTRTSASPRLGLSNPRVMYALDSTDDEVLHVTAAGGAGLHRSNSVLSRRSEMCSPTDSVAAAGVYPLQLVLNEAKFAAHQRSIRRIYMSSDIQVELLYLILNLVIGTNGVLEPMYTSTFTVRAGHRVQVLFHLHMHLNHDANAPAVQGLWSRLVGESGANNDRSSVRVNHSTLPPPRWYHQRSGSLHDRGMRLLFQMTCFRTNLATTYERQDKIGVGGYGAVMAAVVTLDPNGGAPGAASSTTGRSSSFVAVHHRQQELSVMSPVSCTSSASAASQRAFPTASDKIMTTDAVALVTTGGYRNERVAVKIAPVPHHIDDRETLVSFFNEVLLMTHIQDIPEAVRLLDCGCDGTQYLVVMPLYHGSAREWRLRLGPRGALPPLIATATAVPSTTSSVLPPKAASPVASTTTINAFAQCLGLYSTLLRTLCQIHRRRIVHHDLKLDNVFLEIDHHDDNDDDEDGGDEGDGGTPHPSPTAIKKICRLKLGDWGEGEVLPVIGRHHHHQPPQPQQSTYPSAANSRKVSTVAGADLIGGGGLASGGVGGETWSLENSITPQHDLPGTPVPGFGTSVLAGNSLMGYEQIAAAASSSARVLSHPAGSFLGGGASTASVIKRSGGGGGGATLFQALKQLYQKPKGTECIRSPEALLPHKYLPTSLVDKNNNNQPLSDAMNAAAAALLGSSCSSTTASSLNNTTTPQHHLYPHHHERNNAVMFADDVALIVQKSDVWAMGCLLYELLTGDALFGDQDFGQVMHRITSVDPQVFIDPDHLRALRTWGASSPVSSERATTTSSESDSAATVNENEAKRVGVAIEQYLRVLLERDPVRRPTMQQALEMWEELLCRMAWEVEDPCVVVERQDNAAAASPNLLSPSTTNDGSPAAAAGGGTLSTTVSPREHGNRTPAGGMTRASSRRNLKALQQSSILGAAMAQFASSSAARLRTMPWMLILDPSAITAALEMCDENHHHQYGSQAGNQPLSASFMNVSARSRSVSGLYQHDASPSSLMHSGSDEQHRTAILHHVAPSLSVAASRSAYGLSVGGLGSCDNSHHTHSVLSSTSSDAALLQCYSWGVTHLFSFYHIPKAASHFHYQHCQSTLEQVAKEITALDQLYSHTVQQQSTTSKHQLVHVNSASSFYQHHPQHQQQQQQGEQVAVGGFVAVPSPHPVFTHTGSIEASVSFDTSHVTIAGGANAAAPTAPLASAMLTASQPAPSVHPATLPPSFYQTAATTTTAQHQLMSRSSSNLSLVGAAGTVNHHYHQQHAQLNSSMVTASTAAVGANGGAPSWAVAITKHLSTNAVSSLLQTVPDSVVDFAHRLCHQLPAQYHDALMKRGRLLIPSFLVEDVDYAVVATLLVLSVTYRLPILSALFHVRQNCQLDPNRVNLLRTLQTAKMLLAISSLSSAPPSDHPNSISQRMSAILHEESPQHSNIATNTTSPVISTSSSHHASGGLQRRHSTHVDDSITLATAGAPLLLSQLNIHRHVGEGVTPTTTTAMEQPTGPPGSNDSAAATVPLLSTAMLSTSHTSRVHDELPPPLTTHHRSSERRQQDEWCRCVCGLCVYVAPHDDVTGSGGGGSQPLLDQAPPSVSVEHIPVQQLAYQRIATAIKRSTEQPYGGGGGSVKQHHGSPPAALSRSNTPLLPSQAGASTVAAAAAAEQHQQHQQSATMSRTLTSFLVPPAARAALQASIKFFYIRLMAVYGTHLAQSFFSGTSASLHGDIPCAAEYRAELIEGNVSSHELIVAALNEGRPFRKITPVVAAAHGAAPPPSHHANNGHFLPAALTSSLATTASPAQKQQQQQRQHNTDPLHDGTASSDLSSPTTTINSHLSSPQAPPVYSVGRWEASRGGSSNCPVTEYRCVRCRTPTHYSFSVSRPPPLSDSVVVLTWADFPVVRMSPKHVVTVKKEQEDFDRAQNTTASAPLQELSRPLSVSSSTAATPVPFDGGKIEGNPILAAAGHTQQAAHRTTSMSPPSTTTRVSPQRGSSNHHLIRDNDATSKAAVQRSATKLLERTCNDRVHHLWMGRHHLQ